MVTETSEGYEKAELTASGHRDWVGSRACSGGSGSGDASAILAAGQSSGWCVNASRARVYADEGKCKPCEGMCR